MNVSRCNTQRGLSLIELLVAMVIAGVVLTGVVNTLLAGKQNYIFQEQVSYVQENGRFALDIIGRDLRDAGYTGGCNIKTMDVANSLDPTNDQNQLLSTLPVTGYEGGVSVFPSLFSADVHADTDAFILRKGDTDNSFTVTSHNGASAVIHVSPQHSYQKGTILMMVNARCDQMGIFSQTKDPTGGSGNKFDHNSGAGQGHNCTKDLFGDFDCVTCPGGGSCSLSNSYDDGSTVFALIARAYYIGASSYDPNVQSLYSVGLTNGGSAQAMELVSGVEDMQVLYGIDDNPLLEPDGRANRYVTADMITKDESDGSAPFITWDRVVSMRIHLVLRSREPVLEQARAVTLLGKNYNDRFLRQEVSTTVRLRNVALPGNPL